MKSIDEQIAESKCFGVAFSESIRECKICEVRKKCKDTMENKIKNNTLQKPESPLKKLEKSVATELKNDNKYSKKLNNNSNNDQNKINCPNFKKMTLEELEKLAIERHADDSWKKYDNLGIRRMRLTMALKKTYK